jgi:hypothetical protein
MESVHAVGDHLLMLDELGDVNRRWQRPDREADQFFGDCKKGSRNTFAGIRGYLSYRLAFDTASNRSSAADASIVNSAPAGPPAHFFSKYFASPSPISSSNITARTWRT